MPWLHLAGAIAAAITPAPDALPAPEVEPAARVLTATEIIQLQTERYRRLTVPVTIGGQGPFRFMIDTGAQATVLSRGLADQLQLHQRDTATLIAMASTRQVETALVPGFALGSRQFTIATAPLVEGEHLAGADGILGLDSLQHQRVLFDFEASQLAVADAETLGGNRGFDIVVRARARQGQLIIHRAQVDGVEVSVIIDTGAQGSIGNLALQERLRRNRHLEETVMTDITGTQITGQTRMARGLQLGRASLNNFPVTYADSPVFAGLGLADEPAMILGMSELRLFRRVAIDFATRQVLFDLPRNADIGAGGVFQPGSSSRIGQ